MSAEASLAVAEIDRGSNRGDVRAALLSRSFATMPEGDVEMTETWDSTHPACPYAVLDLATRRLRTDVRVVGRRVRMTTDEWRARYVLAN